MPCELEIGSNSEPHESESEVRSVLPKPLWQAGLSERRKNSSCQRGAPTHVPLLYRQWANTGQGRRRLNARAALRAAGHKEFGCDPSNPPLDGSLERSRLGMEPAGVQLGGRTPPNAGLLWQRSSSPLTLPSTSGESNGNSLRPVRRVSPGVERGVASNPKSSCATVVLSLRAEESRITQFAFVRRRAQHSRGMLAAVQGLCKWRQISVPWRRLTTRRL